MPSNSRARTFRSCRCGERRKERRRRWERMGTADTWYCSPAHKQWKCPARLQATDIDAMETNLALNISNDQECFVTGVTAENPRLVLIFSHSHLSAATRRRLCQHPSNRSSPCSRDRTLRRMIPETNTAWTIGSRSTGWSKKTTSSRKTPIRSRTPSSRAHTGIHPKRAPAKSAGPHRKSAPRP